MANKQTGITLRLTAVNATGKVFRDIAATAAHTIQVAQAVWGAVKNVASVVPDSFNKLSKLSDVAQSAGATTEEITKLSGALDILGVKGSAPEELATAFQRMTKYNGQVGVEGFHKMIAEISKLPTIMERSEAAQKVFGKAGLNFLPIIEGDIDALKKLEAGIPGISQAAAEAGDRFSDAMTVMKLGASKVWNEGLMKVAELISGQFTGDVRTAALVCAAQMEYFAKAAWAYLKPFITDTKAAFLQLAEWISRVMNNCLTVVGGIITTAAENFASHIMGALDSIGAGAAAIIARIQGDEERADLILRSARRDRKVDEKDRQKNWDQTFKVFEDQLKWGVGAGPLGNVDLSALQAQRDAAIETAKKAGEAYARAAVTPGAADRAGLGAKSGAGKAAKNVNPEALLGGSYKAITYAMRAGYATAQEKIAKGVDKIAGLLKGVKDNTEAMAENLGLGVLNG